jgi:hypothetical protein
MKKKTSKVVNKARSKTNYTIYTMELRGMTKYTDQLKVCGKLAKELEKQLTRLGKIKLTPVLSKRRNK